MARRERGEEVSAWRLCKEKGMGRFSTCVQSGRARATRRALIELGRRGWTDGAHLATTSLIQLMEKHINHTFNLN